MEETNVEEIKVEATKPAGIKALAVKCKSLLCNSGKKRHIVASIIVLILIAAGIGIYYYKFKATDIGLEGAKNKVISFIKDNEMVPPGTAVTVKEAVMENGLYKLTINIADKQDVVTYLTKDGKKFFPTEPMDTDIKKEDLAKAQAEPDKEIPKTDKPTVDLYVMSFCPFGNQSEDTLKSAYDLLKNKVNFNFHYIVSSNGDEIQSLHGPSEVAQDEIEACILKDYGKDKWFSLVEYVNKNCGKSTDTPCWEAGAKSLGIVASKVTSCVKSDGLALMKDNEKASTEAGAQGSPTMLINGVSTSVVYQYGNSEAYKKVICDAFSKAPAECSKTLSTSTNTATAGGSCN